MTKPPRVWVIRRVFVVHTYQVTKASRQTCAWLSIADLMREELKPDGYRSVVYPSRDTAEAAAIGLTLSGVTGTLTAKPAFGVLSRWARGSTRTGGTGRLPRPSSRGSRNGG